MEMFLTNTSCLLYLYIYNTNKVFKLFIPHNIVFSRCLKPLRFGSSGKGVQ